MHTRFLVVFISLLTLPYPNSVVGQVSCGDFQRRFIEETRQIQALDLADLFDLGLPNLELVKQQNNVSISQILSDFSLEQILALRQNADFVIRDLTNDNQLDLLLHTDSNITILIRDGSGFREVLNIDVVNFKPSIGDIDNDGDRDIIFGDRGDNILLIRNQGNEVFALEMAHLFSGFRQGSIETEELFDVDGDGDLDVLYKFTPNIQAGFGTFYNLEWIENEGGFFNQKSNIIAQGLCGPLAVGDLDADGDKDIVLGASRSCSVTSFNDPNLTLYLNEGSAFQQYIYSGQSSYYFQDIQLGDIDNNGILNIIGITEEFADFSIDNGPMVVLELSSCFQESCVFDEFSFPGLTGFDRAEQMVLGDLDGDLDLDILVTTCNGSCLEALINNACFTNSPPSPPTNLTCTQIDGGIRLNWELAQDVNQPSASLTYNIEVYSQDFMGQYIVSPESLTDSGLGKIIRFGDQCHNLSWEITGLPQGNYCYRVQSIDHSFVGGTWSDEACCAMELCSDAIPVLCGRDTIGDTANPMLLNKISDYAICASGSDFHQPELIYQIVDFQVDEFSTSDIYISMKELGTEMEAGLDVFIIENCNELVDEELMAQCIDSVVRTGDGNPALIQIANPNPQSTYFVIVDSKNTPGDFRLSLSCPDECADDEIIFCDDPKLLNNREDGSASISAYYVPDSSTYLDNYGGHDYKVPFGAPEDGDYSIELMQEESILDLFILSECNPFKCIAYQTDDMESTKTIDLFLNQGDTIYLVVDAPRGQRADFTLAVRCCLADSSEISFAPNRLDTIICKIEDSAIPLTVQHNGPLNIPYSFLLTDTLDIILKEIDSQFDASLLSIGVYRIHGVSYHSELIFTRGQELSNISGTICQVLSTNHLSLTIDSSYFFDIDTTLCFGQSFAICDTTLTTSGLHIINCQTRYGCDSIFNINILIDTPSIDIMGSETFCLGDSVILNTTGDFEDYLWSTGETTDSIIVNESGMYSVTVTTINGCSDSASISVVEQEELLVELGSDTTLCEGVVFNIDAGVFHQYLWNNGDTTQSINVTSAGNHSVTVQDLQGCEGADDINILFIPSPVANAKSDRSICRGDSILVIGEGGESCRWMDVDGNVISTSCILMDTLKISTTYILEVKNTSESSEDFAQVSCIDYDTLQVNVFSDTLSLELITDTLICSGEMIELTKSINCADCICEWTTEEDLFDPISCVGETAPMQSTRYGLTIIDRNGCVARDSVFVGVATSPTADAGEDQDLCPGMPLILRGTGGSICTWFNMAHDTISVDCSYSGEIEASETFVLEVTNTMTFASLGEKTCVDADTVQVSIFQEGQGVVLIDDTVICAGQTIDLVQSLDCGECVCEWSPSLGLEQPDQCLSSATLFESTTYVVTAESPNGCRDSDTVHVEVVSMPTARVAFTDSSICSGDALTLSGSGGERCEWLDESSQVLHKLCSFIDTPSLSAKYFFVAANEGLTTCSDTTEVSIQVVQPPTINIIDDTTICRGSAIELLTFSDCQDCQCEWGPNQDFVNPNFCDPMAFPTEDVQYVLTAVKESTCFFSDSVNITVLDPVVIETKNDHFNVRRNNATSIPIDSLLVNDSSLGTSPLVELITSDLPSEISVAIVGDQLEVLASNILGLHDFQYVVQDQNCGSEDTATVELLVVHSDVVAICNPDEDEGGCQVIVDIEDYQENDIAIFDREGNIVHVANPYRNDWNGVNIQTGERVPTGSYYFVLELGKNRITEVDGGPLKGVITIIRR